MQTKIFNVTPKWASAQLEELSKRVAAGTFRQRKLRERMINRFAEDMATGAWQLTHQGIAFDENNNLIDGQHRLMAVVKANVPVQMQVTTGLPAKGTMDALDSGAARSIANQLQVSHAYTNANLNAAVARQLAILALDVKDSLHKYATKPPMTVAATIWMLETMNINAAIERALAIISNNRLRASFTFAAWALYWRWNKEKADDFLTKFNNLVNLGEGHPAMMLHRYVTSTALRPRRDQLHTMRIVSYCLRMFDDGKVIDALNARIRPSREAQIWLVNLDGGKLMEQIYRRLIAPMSNGSVGKAELAKGK